MKSNEKYNKIISLEKANSFFNESFVAMYKNSYKNIIEDEQINNILNESKRIAKNSLNHPGKNTLLAGSVQSGKTSFYLSLIANLFDNDSNLCFIFPAIDNILFNQTVKRINTVFNKRIRLFTLKDIKGEENSKIAEINRSIEGNSKIILMGLKNDSQISTGIKIIGSLKGIKKPFILDDEGDQASFDDISKADATTTYEKLTTLFKNRKDFSYFSITATPYAHIFVNKDSTMKPDFAFAIPQSHKYIGVNWYHSQDNNVIRKISNKDIDQIRNLKIVPNSLKDALLEYFTYSALKHLKDGVPSETSFLMHSHKKNSAHEKLAIWMSSAVENLKKKIITDNSKTIEKLKEILFESHFNIDFDFDGFKELLINHMKNSQVIIGNQKNREFSEILKTGSTILNNIYVGSQMLQRGVTLPNLLVTYFTHRNDQTGNSDTIMQRARWFGYRENYKHLTKLYLDKKTIEDFRGLLLANDDMFYRLEELNKINNKFNAENFEERLLVGDADLRATRRTVVKTSKIPIPRIMRENNIQDNDVARRIWNWINKSESKFDNILKFNAVEIGNLEDFANSHFYNEILDSFETFEFLKYKLLQNSEKRGHRVIFVNMGIPFKGYDRIRERTLLNDEGKIQNFLQGHSHEDGNNYYYGDAYLCRHKEFENALIVEIHKMIDKNSNKIIHKIVIVAPEDSITENIFKEE